MARGLLVTCLFALIGVSLVLMRQEMARASARVQSLHRRQVQLQQTLWSRQMELADLRIPARVRDRLDGLGLSLSPPRVQRRAAVSQESQQRGILRTDD